MIVPLVILIIVAYGGFALAVAFVSIVTFFLVFSNILFAGMVERMAGGKE